MSKGKHKERARILKACHNNPEDMLDMVNYYRDEMDYVEPKRKPKIKIKGIKTPTLEILKYLISKGDVYVK